MAIDVSERLKNYAKGHAETTEAEYNAQKEKWVSYYDLVADAHAKAVGNVEKVLAAKHRKHETLSQLAMIAVTLIGGAVVGAISPLVQSRIYPKFNTGQWQIAGDTFTGKGYQFIYTHGDYSATAAKLWGDGIAKGVERKLDDLVSSFVPKSVTYKVPDGLVSAITTGDFASIKTQLQIALREAGGVMSSQLALLKSKINTTAEFGQAILEAAAAQTPDFNKLEPPEQERLGKVFLDKYFNGLRQAYANSWSYFASDPNHATVRHLSSRIEKELWKLWMLEREFKYGDYYEGGVRGYRRAVVGKNNEIITYDVLNYLVNDLGVTELYDVYWRLEDTYGTAFAKRTGSTPDSYVEDPDDLPILTDWAKNHKHIQGVLDATKRNLPSIVDAAKLFPNAGQLPVISVP